MKIKSFVLILGIVLLIGLVSGEIATLGTFKQGECIELKQTCADCTYVNIVSVMYPNSSIGMELTSMNQNGVAFTYDYCNTTEFGTYIVNMEGDVGGTSTVVAYDFDVTPNGRALNSSETWFYIIGLIILTFFLVFSIVGIFKSEHYTGKFALFWLSYVLAILLFFSTWQIFTGYSVGFIGISGIFKIAFYVLITAMFPMLLLSLAWIFYIHTVTEEMKDMMERGMGMEEAWSRSGRKVFKW